MKRTSWGLPTDAGAVGTLTALYQPRSHALRRPIATYASGVRTRRKTGTQELWMVSARRESNYVLRRVMWPSVCVRQTTGRRHIPSAVHILRRIGGAYTKIPVMSPKAETTALAADLRSELESVYAFISSRVGGNRTLAEDLTQETMLAALQGTFDASRGPLSAWLIGIALRKIADHERRKAMSKRHLEEAARDLAIRMIREPLPAEWLQRDEVRTVVTEGLSRLPGSTALLLIRKYFEGASVSELAAELGASEKAVESQLTRARAAFHEAVQRFGQE